MAPIIPLDDPVRVLIVVIGAADEIATVGGIPERLSLWAGSDDELGEWSARGEWAGNRWANHCTAVAAAGDPPPRADVFVPGDSTSGPPFRENSCE